jgi:hypothetical protein
MEGAMTYATTWAAANPAHLTAIVFASDGDPTGCLNNGVSGTADAAAAALAANPSVPTFVIGVGTALTDLNQIAQAGGTTQAYLVDSGSNTTQEFIDALNKIREAGQCKFQIPTPNMGMADFNKVNVSLIDPNGAPPVELKNVGTAAGCDPTDGGWYYDDPAAPKIIELCPASCDAVMASDADVQVLLGCATIVK